VPDRNRHREFVALIEQSKRLIYKVCFAYSKSPEDRQDLFQEIVVQLWKSFGRYKKERKFSTWLYRIALNTAISHVRKAGRRYRHETSAVEPILGTTASTILRDYETEDVTALKRQIDQLGEMNKALIVLHLEGNSYREIAEVLGISESNVGTKLNRVKQQLRRTLAPAAH
jgi:RNA polymerase sigma-70 factor (ECF subfamily)